MASNVIDYFATLGRKSLTCKSFESLWVNDKLRSPSEIWNEAITDIAIVHQGEQLPDSSWQSIDHSIDNRPIASRSTIAVRRRGASKRLDHITKIKLIKKGDVIPLGFELIDMSITKMFPAEIENVGALAIKRAQASEVTFIQGQPLVDDICLVLVNEGEEVPEGYVSLERISTQKEPNRGAKAAQGATKIVLAYHQRPAMGLCDLSYESATLDRYPQKDQHEFPLPVVELPMFAFPHDLRLSYSSTIRFPLPVFFSFVFTNSKGMHRYAACLRFYEIVPKEEIEAVYREVYGSNQDFVLPPSTAVFCPKVICVVSRMPFYRAMRRYLCQIFSMSLSSLPCPLEFFIASVVGQVPLPVAGGRPFHVVQDAALISSTSHAMNAIEFEVPLPRFFPPMDLDFAAPLRCLSVDRLLAVFALMLRESKMVFLCCSNTLLTETMETLRSLLFPLKWSSCFVSRLPDALSGLLEAPGGFMIGLHMFEDKDNDVEVAESHMDKHFGDRKAVRQTQWTHSLTAGTFIVDLSSNAVFQYDGKSTQTPLSTTALNNLVHTLPPGPRKRLQRKLQHIATSYCIGPQTVGLDRFDSAFDFQAYEDVQEPATVTSLSWENFPTLEVRDYFMNFMADLLGNYQKYIIPPLEDMGADTYRTFKEEFSVEEYLNDAGPTVRPVLELLVDTQMFAVLLQQRSEASDYSLVFFESAGELMREFKLQAGGHNLKDLSGGSFSTSNNIPDMVAPLYKLLAAKAWAAANGKYYHTDAEKDVSHDSNDSPMSNKESLEHTVPPDKPEERKYFASLRSQASSKRLVVGSPPFGKKDPAKAAKALTPLDYLVTALDEMEIEAAKRSFVSGLMATPKKRGIVGSRNELDRRANLRLHDRSLGPLIIPGPSKALLNTTLPHAISASRRHGHHDSLSPDRIDDTNSVVTCSTDVSDDESVTLPIYCKAIAEFGGQSPLNHGESNYIMAMVALRIEQSSSSIHADESNEIEYESDVERDSEGRFTYQIGWPVLHSRLLKLARRSVHTRLSGLRKSRVFALQMINRNIQLFLRAPTEQWACYRSIACGGNERSSSDLDSSNNGSNLKTVSPVPQNNLRNILSGASNSASLVAESSVVSSSVLEVLSVSLLLLCTRTLHEAKPVCDMLQVLGILAQADSMGMLPKFDETIWRTLLVACANTGGDVMRKVACVIFDTLTACGITPDALTYGSYTRALAATKYAHDGRSDGQQMDQFFFLEEIGLAWFQQRSAVIEQSQADISVPEVRSAPAKGGGMLSTMFSRKKRSNVPATRRRINTKLIGGLETTGASEAAFITANQLGLVRPAAAYALLCPSGSFISAPPRYASSFQSSDAIEELSQELSGRIGKLMLDYKSPSPPTWLNSRSSSVVGAGLRSPRKLDLSQFAEKNVCDDEVSRSAAEMLGNAEAMKDLFGPGASTVSTDSSEVKKAARDESENRGTAYMNSALEAAVSTSSAAASTVKHYGNIFIGGLPTPKRPSAVLSEQALQNVVKSQNLSGLATPDNGEELIQQPSPTTTNMGRMSRLTQSVFSNPFQFKEKEKEKEKDKSSLLDNVLSTFSGSSVQASAITVKMTHQKPSQPYNNPYNEPLDKDMDGRGSNMSIRFSDDEADDSDDDMMSRRSSSTSIRIRESSKEKGPRRSSSVMSAPLIGTEVGTGGGTPRRASFDNLDSLRSFKNVNGIIVTINVKDERSASDEAAGPSGLSTSDDATAAPSSVHLTPLSNPRNLFGEPSERMYESPVTSDIHLDELLFCPADTLSLIDTPFAHEKECINSPDVPQGEVRSLSYLSEFTACSREVTDHVSNDVVVNGTAVAAAVHAQNEPRSPRPGDPELKISLATLQLGCPPQISALTPEPSTPSPSLAPGHKRLNVLAMQNDLLSTFTSAFIREGCAVGIHSATPCPHCSHTLLDEEVMAVWAGSNPRDSMGPLSRLAPSVHETGSALSLSEKVPDTPPTSSSDMRGCDIEAAHCINCPVCWTKYSPMLNIACYELKHCPQSTKGPEPFSPFSPRLTTVAEWTPSPSSMFSPGSAVPSSPEPSPLVPPSGGPRRPSQKEEQTGEMTLKVLWTESVSYLSPKGLRLALEEQMERIGERVADPCWLHVHRPAVYWNILWFSSRLKVPTGFLASPPSPSLPPPTSRIHSHSERDLSEAVVRTGSEREGTQVPGSAQMSQSFKSRGLGVEGAGPPPIWHLPTVIGWKESVVKVRVHQCLSKGIATGLSCSASLSSFSADTSTAHTEALQLADLFPGCDDVPPEILFGLSAENTTSRLINIRPNSTSLSSSSSSLSPVINRSMSSPLLMTLLRSRSASTPVKLGIQSPPVGEVKLSPGAPATPMSTSKSTSPVRAPSTRLDRAAEFLDGTAEGMRRAILEIGKYQWLMSEIKNAVTYFAEEKRSEGMSFDSETKCDMEGSNRKSQNSNIIDNCLEDEGSRETEGKAMLTNDEISNENYLKKILESKKGPHVLAREIYIDLLTLFYMQKSKKSLGSGRTESAVRKADLFKENTFEKLYLTVVRELLLPTDYEALGTTETEMTCCAAGKSAQAFRVGMGFLF